MALDRLLPVSTTPGAITGNFYMDQVQEEVTGLWDRARIKLTAVSGTNTITATFVPALTAGLVDGMNVILRPVATNTGAVTLNGNPVVDGEGNALAAGALRINGVYDLIYVSAVTSWFIEGYFPAASVAVGLKLINTQVASSSASLDFVHGVSGVVFDDTYDSYNFDLSAVKPATDDVELWMRIGTGAGPTYQTANYQYATTHLTASGTNNNQSSASASRIILAGTTLATRAVGSAAGEHVNGTVRVCNPESTTDFFQVYYQTVYSEALGGDSTNCGGSGRYTSGTAITAVRFMWETGNIASGRITMYGMTKV